jgi:hypothetical protein
MNRIERLIWEETQLATIQGSQRETLGMRGAKVVAIVALVGAVAILATRVSIPHLDDVMVQALAPSSIFYTPVAAPNRASDVRRATNTQSHDPADKDDH